MDLNASPLPEDDEQPYAEHIENVLTQEERTESAVSTYRRVIYYFSLVKSFEICCIRMRMPQSVGCFVAQLLWNFL